MTRRTLLALAVVSALAMALIRPAPALAERVERPSGSPSLVSHEPLEAGGGGMIVGGGLALVLPMLIVEGGVGLGSGFDLVGRYMSVLGVLHFPELGLRYSPGRFGNVQLGFRFTANASLFGLQSDQPSYASTLYVAPEAGLTWFASKQTRAVFGLGGEVDYLELAVVEQEDSATFGLRWDTTVVRAGFVTTFTDELDAFAALRLRIPTETLQVEASAFLLIPLIEGGVSWAF